MAVKKTPFVIAYDFDGTLAPGNMQEYDFIPELGMKKKEFWATVNELTQAQEADEILAYMQKMLEEARHKKIPVTKQSFQDYGKKIKFFDGVEEWFERINAYGNERDINVQHFIISSGLREMIEGTKIAKYFKRIYASGFMYDVNNVAFWPALGVNYTTKTQYLFRINKGALNVSDRDKVNEYVAPEDRSVPFTNMCFIGDGLTDIPCMRLVREYGGNSIAVYKKGKAGDKKKVLKLVEEKRATIAAIANYTSGSEIDKAVKGMLNKVAAQADIDRAGIK